MSTFRTVSFLAFKDLKRDKKIALLVIFLIAFSYVNITFFAAFLNGLGNAFQEEIVNTETSHIIITPSESTDIKYIPNTDSARNKIELNSDVVATAARLNVPVRIKFRDKEFSVRAVGIKESDESIVTTTASYLVSGTFLSDNSNNEIVLGKFIAGERIEDTLGQERFGALVKGLGVRVGSVVEIAYPNGMSKEYRIRGIIGSNGFNAVSQSAFITFEEAESVLGTNDQASSILVRLDDKYQADEVKKFILDQGIKNVEVKTWSEASSFTGAINSTFSVVILVSSLVGVIIVVATLGIVIFINTSRKKRIIGVLKAIGMRDRQVMLIFLAESVLFGLIGLALGFAIFAGVIYYMDANPILLPVGTLRPTLGADAMINAGVLIIAASVVAGYVPARFAARQKILETIKTVE